MREDLGLAYANFIKALEVRPGLAYVWSNAGVVLRRNGQTGDAVFAYRTALQYDPDHSVAVTPQDMASIDIQHRRYTRFGQFDVGLGFERREDKATGINVRDTRGYLQWSYLWGH